MFVSLAVDLAFQSCVVELNSFKILKCPSLPHTYRYKLFNTIYNFSKSYQSCNFILYYVWFCFKDHGG